MKKLLVSFALSFCVFSSANALTPISKDDILNATGPQVALTPISKDDILNTTGSQVALTPISKDDILNAIAAMPI